RRTQVELMLEPGRFLADDLVADEQPSFSLAAASVAQVDELRRQAKVLLQDDARQRHRRVAVGIARQDPGLIDRLLAENTNRERRPIAANPTGRNDAQPWQALVVDDGEQGDVVSP